MTLFSLSLSLSLKMAQKILLGGICKIEVVQWTNVFLYVDGSNLVDLLLSPTP